MTTASSGIGRSNMPLGCRQHHPRCNGGGTRSRRQRAGGHHHDRLVARDAVDAGDRRAGDVHRAGPRHARRPLSLLPRRIGSQVEPRTVNSRSVAPGTPIGAASGGAAHRAGAATSSAGDRRRRAATWCASSAAAVLVELDLRVLRRPATWPSPAAQPWRCSAASQLGEEGQEAIPGLEPSRADPWRRSLRQRALLHFHVRGQVSLSRLQGLVPWPERDHRSIHPRLE
jgi:hypothetical protein